MSRLCHVQCIASKEIHALSFSCRVSALYSLCVYWIMKAYLCNTAVGLCNCFPVLDIMLVFIRQRNSQHKWSNSLMIIDDSEFTCVVVYLSISSVDQSVICFQSIPRRRSHTTTYTTAFVVVFTRFSIGSVGFLWYRLSAGLAQTHLCRQLRLSSPAATVLHHSLISSSVWIGL